jgi:hypothetical protein
VESSCELGNEPSGSIKCWELPSGCTTCGLSSGTQLHRVSNDPHRAPGFPVGSFDRNLDLPESDLVPGPDERSQ